MTDDYNGSDRLNDWPISYCLVIPGDGPRIIHRTENKFNNFSSNIVRRWWSAILYTHAIHSVYIYTENALIGKRGERVYNENFMPNTKLSIAYTLRFSMWFPRTFSMLAINPECTWTGFHITRCTTSLQDWSS